MNKHEFQGEILLFITALIWGTSFVAQRVGMAYIGPFTFTATRFFIGTLSLLVIILILDAAGSGQKQAGRTGSTKDLLVGGAACGFALFSAISFQQFGLQYTSAGKAGFITTLYILIVPIFGLFLNKKVGRQIWMAIGLAVIGLYLLTVTQGTSIARGDLIVLFGTVFWAIHILVIDHFAPKVVGLKLSFMQFLVAGTISAIVAGIAETVEISSMLKSAGPILYTGIVVVGFAYTLQIFGQKNANPTVAAIILSLESVFAVVSGMVLLREVMSIREIIGCALMFAAVIITNVKPANRH